MTLRKTRVCMDGLPGSYEAFVEDRLWNGWTTPWFTGAEARRIAEGINAQYNEHVLSKLVYDDYLLAFIEIEMHLIEGNNIGEVMTQIYPGTTIYRTDDGMRHLLFPVGNSSWCWEECPEEGNGTPDDDSRSSTTNAQL